MICAKPSASFWSVLFICIFSAALACRASRQTTSSPRSRSACTSHGVIGPVSSPTRASSPACPLTIRSSCSGSVEHWPRQSLRPVSLTTQIEVSFCDTSKPTNRAILQSPMCELPSIAARIAALWAPHAVDRDYPMSTHATAPRELPQAQPWCARQSARAQTRRKRRRCRTRGARWRWSCRSAHRPQSAPSGRHFGCADPRPY